MQWQCYFGIPEGTCAIFCISRDHDFLTRVNVLFTRGHDLLTRGHDLLSRSHDWWSRGHELVSQRHDLICHGHDLKNIAGVPSRIPYATAHNWCIVLSEFNLRNCFILALLFCAR